MKNSSNAFRSLLTAVAFAACVLTANGLHAQKDAKGCTDSPYISRFPGTFISMCDAKDDDSFSFIIGAGKPYKTIEGKKFHVIYTMAPTASNVQVAQPEHCLAPGQLDQRLHERRHHPQHLAQE
ncbi:MAG: hypothetical protein ABR928_14105 [Terracidiphilus sp.]